MKDRILYLFLFALFVGDTFAQSSAERLDTAWAHLKRELASQGINASEIIGRRGGIDIDSSAGVESVASGRIYNPYGTLGGCFIFAVRTTFTSRDNDNGMVVIMKGGRILWMSKPFGGVGGGESFSVSDLNKDGRVDIVSKWMAGEHAEDWQLWIHSWDGVYARPINSNDGIESDLHGADFDFIDPAGEGIMSITTEIYEYDNAYIKVGHATFKWNGKQYVEWKKKRSAKE